MSETPNHIPEIWLSRIGGADASGWLGAFGESPQAAVADLLWDAFYLGPLNLVDRGQLLAGLLDLLGNSEAFAERLDAEMTRWVEENWGRFERRAESLASAWSCLCNVTEFSAKLHEDSRLKNCAETLRARFAERQKFLGSFSTAPAADPLGGYLAVVAEFQGSDRSLASFWHSMCDLPDAVPFYHAGYAMLGLRRLKASDPDEQGSLRAEVVLGLIHLARAFDRLARERKLRDDLAETTFRRVALQTAAAYPGSLGWAKYGIAETLELPQRARNWLLAAIPPHAKAVQRELGRIKQTEGRHRPRRVIQPDSSWGNRVSELAARLRKGDRSCLPEVRRLLDEQRRYAEATGETYNIVRTLCNFASRVLQFSPKLALRWAREACNWEPHDDYTWNTIRTVLLERPEWRTEALRIAWVAWKRFPADAVAHSGLAEALRGVRRYREAEAIYRIAIERFPTNPVVRNGLANILVRMRRWKEAEAEYRHSIKLGYVDATTYTSLAYLVHNRGEAGRAEALGLIAHALELEPHARVAKALKQKLAAGEEASLDDLVIDKWDDVADANFEAETPFALGREGWDVEQEAYRPPDVEEPEPEPLPEQPVILEGGASAPPAEDDELTDDQPDLIKAVEAEEPRPEVKAGESQPEVTERQAEPKIKPGAEKREAPRVEPLVRPAPKSVSESGYKTEASQTPPAVEQKRPAPTTGQKTSDKSLQDSRPSAEEVRDSKPAPEESPEIRQAEVVSEQVGTPEAEPKVTAGAVPKPEHFKLSNTLTTAALVAEAYFYRMWAKEVDGAETAALRKRAADLLAQAERLSPEDAQVLAERAALSVDSGDTSATYQSLTTQLSSHAAAVPLLILKARLDRERAREQERRLDRMALAELCQAPQLLREFNPSLGPLFNFQRGLAALALLDGDERKKAASDSFSSFRRKLAYSADLERKERETALNRHRREVPGFHEWLQTYVNRRVFAGLAETETVGVNDIPTLEAAWDQLRPAIEEVEDVFGDRLTFGSL